MIRLHVSAADISRVRFAISPMWETITSLRTLTSPDGGLAMHQPWRDWVRGRLGGVDLFLLTALVRPAGYFPTSWCPRRHCAPPRSQRPGASWPPPIPLRCHRSCGTWPPPGRRAGGAPRRAGRSAARAGRAARRRDRRGRRSAGEVLAGRHRAALAAPARAAQRRSRAPPGATGRRWHRRAAAQPAPVGQLWRGRAAHRQVLRR